MDGYEVVTGVIDAITVDKISKFLQKNDIPFHLTHGHTIRKDMITSNPPGICTVCGKDRGLTIVCQGCGWVDPPTKQK